MAVSSTCLDMSPCWSLVSGLNWHRIRGGRGNPSGPKPCPSPPEIQPSACQGVKSPGTRICSRSQAFLNSDAGMTLSALSLPRADRDRFPRESWNSLSSLLFSPSSLVVLSVSRYWLVGRGRSLRGAGPTRLSVLHRARFASSLFSERLFASLHW